MFIEERRSRLLSFIERKVQEYERLTDAYMSLCDGNDIFKVKESGVIPNAEQLRIAGECTVSIISGELAVCLSYFSQKMKDYMPLEVFRKVREDTLIPLGEYSGSYTLEADRKNANVVFNGKIKRYEIINGEGEQIGDNTVMIKHVKAYGFVGINAVLCD